MSISFKPTSIALPDSTSLFKRSPSCSPSVKFQKDPFDKPGLEYPHAATNTSTPPLKTLSFPKTPYPKDGDVSNPMEESQAFFSLPPSPHPKESGDYFLQELTSESLAGLLSSGVRALLVDLRPSIHFAKCHIPDSISVSVPSTLLRRESHNLDKVAAGLGDQSHSAILGGWREYAAIVFIDANSSSLSDTSPISLLYRKFPLPSNSTFSWLRGGFKHFQTIFPDKVKATKGPLLNSVTNTNSLSSNLLGPLTCPVAGRDTLGRSTQFYDSLRQYNTATNTLAETIPIQMPIAGSSQILGPNASALPLFLQKMLEENFGEKAMAEAFQKLDLQEQSRLREIATVNSEPMVRSRYCVSAGIEKGHKNRYVNIWPYEHARIKLDEFNPGESDYVNASLIHESITNNRYIATQGPLPSTFRDFWQLIWQCNTRVIVMLTKEEEGGRTRCHRYWPDTLGECLNIDGKFEVKLLQKAVCSRTGLLTIRKFLLTRDDAPSSPRMIVQIQFSGWPDFGVPEEPTLLLRVRNLTRQFQSAFESRDGSTGPIAVHCSAGCGRTGAFCTIDSAISALDSGKASCYPDVVYTIVESFRDQRLSMVQTHRQLVLCYETLIWYLLSDRRCGGLSGLCPNLRRVHVSTPDPSTPFFDTDSYFTPGPFPIGGDSYFSLPPSNHGAHSAGGEGFPFFK